MRIDHGLDTQDAAARALLAGLGWVVDEAAVPLRVGGDLLSTDSFALARLWHTPLLLRPVAKEARPDNGRFTATLIVEGRGVLTIDGAPHSFEPGTLLIYDRQLSESMQADASIAAIHVSHWWTAILRAGQRREDVPVASRPPAQLVGLLIAMVNTTFEQRLDESDLGFAAWLASIDSAVSSLLGSTLRARAALASPVTLYERALAVIQERHADPAFTVAELAEHFDVSKPWLHRAFAEQDTSPRRVLMDTRIAHARALLPLLPTPAAIASAAEASGFGTSRALRRALRAEEPHTPPTGVS